MNTALVFIPHKYRGHLEEELALVRTVYPEIEDIIYVRRPNPKYYIPMNRLEYIKNTGSEIIVLDGLRPVQKINILRTTGKEPVDRVDLILEIFALHAGSKEAKMQIELARLKHRLPIIKEAIRRAKLGELHGFLGSGRYGYEKYYRMVKEREARIRRELYKLSKTREIRRKKRIKYGLPHVSIVGYTCSGKTTLFNTLTGYNKPVGPEPFTTLNPKTGSFFFNGKKFIVIDTVGFIRDLPPEIIDAFYATLEEIVYSDIIINVIDISKGIDEALKELRETRKILLGLGIHGKPVIIALNKIDLIDPQDLTGILRKLNKLLEPSEIPIMISARTGYNIELLKRLINDISSGDLNAENICVEIRA